MLGGLRSGLVRGVGAAGRKKGEAKRNEKDIALAMVRQSKSE